MDALHAGRKPRETSAGADVPELCNKFLNHKRALVDAGELSPRTLDEYKGACDEVVAAFGKRRLLEDIDSDDFAELRNRLSRKYGACRLGNTIQYIRSLFKYADDADLIDRPMRFGSGFRRPSKKVLRLNRAKNGPKLRVSFETAREAELGRRPASPLGHRAFPAGPGWRGAGALH
jgi:hypothetical protein